LCIFPFPHGRYAGVVNSIISPAPSITPDKLHHRQRAGIHFTRCAIIKVSQCRPV